MGLLNKVIYAERSMLSVLIVSCSAYAQCGVPSRARFMPALACLESEIYPSSSLHLPASGTPRAISCPIFDLVVRQEEQNLLVSRSAELARRQRRRCVPSSRRYRRATLRRRRCRYSGAMGPPTSGPGGTTTVHRGQAHVATLPPVRCKCLFECWSRTVDGVAPPARTLQTYGSSINGNSTS